MMLSQWEPARRSCSDRHSSRDRSSRAACRFRADSVPWLARRTSRIHILETASCRLQKRISCGVSQGEAEHNQCI